MNKERAEQITLTLMRVVVGLLFMMHGAAILFGWFGGMPGDTKVTLLSQQGLGGMLEFFGGILIMLGLVTRVVAFILSGEMAVAYFQFHQPMGSIPIQNHGEPAVLFCFIFLYLVARGAGLYSFDALFARNRPRHAMPTGRPAIQS